MTKSILKRVKDQIAAKEECKECDFEKAIRVSRATMVCSKCGRDLGIEYYFWYEATHPEWFKENNK